MASPKIFINENYTKKNGECTVYVIVHLKGKSIKFNTGVACVPTNFDYEKMRIKGNSKSVKDENLIIEKSLARINDISVRYRLQNKELTPELLKKEWVNPGRTIDFYKWIEQTIEDRKKGGDISASSTRQHLVLVSKLKQFKRNLAFAEIDSEMLEQFRRYLRTEFGNDINTIHNTLKNLRTYTNIALRQNIISDNPFDNFTFKKAATTRVFLSDKELKLLWQLYLSSNLPENYRRVLRHFLFMCLTGLRISDLKHITHNEIIGKKLVFLPEKTKGIKRTIIKLPLNKYALQLIADEGTGTGKVFNCISEQRMNDKLKEIAATAKVAKHITNHVGRHTFATMYYRKTRDVAGLKYLLGHSRIEQTMVYVHITDEEINESMKDFEAKLLL